MNRILISREELSFCLGMANLFFWGVAEIPQIITNYQTKSGQGVSLFFLGTWAVGDVLNLVGCALEPATLPTQLYAAVLYAAVTLILVLQTLYYHYTVGWQENEFIPVNGQLPHPRDEEDGKNLAEVGRPPIRTAPIPLTANESLSSRRYIRRTSARSLTNSGTSTVVSYSGACSAPIVSAPSLLLDAESPSPLLATLPSLSSRAALMGVCTSLPLPTGGFEVEFPAVPDALQKAFIREVSFGNLLGWMMAVIYMTGRLPQIIHNIRRGSIEGLSPFMFLLAILGNASYVSRL